MTEVQPVGRYEWERVFRRCLLPGPVKGVARALAEFADADGTHIMAGVRTIALSAGFSERATRSALDDLRRLGLIQRVGWGSNGGRRAVADEHRLTLPLDLLDAVEMLPPDTRDWGRSAAPAPVDGRRPTRGSPAPGAGDGAAPVENSAESVDAPVDSPVENQESRPSRRPDHRHVTTGSPAAQDRSPAPHDAITGTTCRLPTQYQARHQPKTNVTTRPP